MAMQARHHSHDYFLSRGGSLFLDEHAGCVPSSPTAIGHTPLLSDVPGSEIINFGYGFLPSTKRARTGDDDHRVVRPPAQVMGSGTAAAASISGREIDALIRVESERMRAALESAWRRHAGALVSAVARTAAWRMRAAERELDRPRRRNAELEEKARQMGAECQAWMGVATTHEAVAAGLRATLDQQQQHAGTGGDGCGEAEDAQSCCLETSRSGRGLVSAAADGDAASRGSGCSSSSPSCNSCGSRDACVLLLPCRHLCLCRACEPAVDTCPVCAVAKNASLLVLFS